MKRCVLYNFNAYCTEKKSQKVLLSWRPFWSNFWSVICYIFLFLEKRLVSYKILHIYSWQYSDGWETKNIFDRYCPLLWAILTFVFLGEVAHFHYFSLILKKGSVCFHEILQSYSLYYFRNHVKKNMAYRVDFTRLF